MTSPRKQSAPLKLGSATSIPWLCSLSAAFVTVILSGCAAYNPYVASQSKNECESSAPSSPSLSYACEKREQVEAKRAQLVEAQNGVASAIFPLAGYVGYKAARSATNAATTAVGALGLAGFGLSEYLIQQQRFMLYDRGEKALSCAIDLYRVNAVSSQSVAVAVAQARYQIALQQAEDLQKIVIQSKSADPNGAAKFEQDLAASKSIVATAESSTLLSAQLYQATDRIVSELNTALSNTVLALTTLSQQQTTLQNASSKPTGRKPALPSLATDLNVSVRGTTILSVVVSSAPAAATVAVAYDQATADLLDALQDNAPSSVDFSSCTVGVYQPTTSTPTTALSLDQKEVVVSATKTPATVHITGGTAKYSADYATTQTGTVPKLSISQVGSAWILSISDNGAPAKQTYAVVVSDQAGNTAQLTVDTQ